LKRARILSDGHLELLKSLCHIYVIRLDDLREMLELFVRREELERRLVPEGEASAARKTRKMSVLRVADRKLTGIRHNNAVAFAGIAIGLASFLCLC
jgi:hypothetical protein